MVAIERRGRQPLRWAAAFSTFVAALGIASLARADAGTAGEDKPAWVVEWKDGFRVESSDKRFKLKFGGRIHADWSFADPDEATEAAFGPIRDGNEFRRARIYFSGVVYEKVEFKAEYDFAGGEAAFKDVYVGFLETPVGDIRVGHFKEPFSFEELTSSNDIVFVERSLPNVFAPSRNTGLMFHDHMGDRLTWAAGIFREADDFGTTQDAEGKSNWTARVTGLPLYGEKRLLHLGLSASRKDLGRDRFRFRQRPEAHLSPRLVDTGAFAADRVQLLDGEAVFVSGRFWAASEYTWARADASPLEDPTFSGAYQQVGVFLTGERRAYDTEHGVFGKQKPARDLGRGPGAWEIALRHSTLDLNDGALSGGKLESWTLALNGYLNPVTRLMINYVDSEREDLPDVGARFLSVRLRLVF